MRSHFPRIRAQTFFFLACACFEGHGFLHLCLYAQFPSFDFADTGCITDRKLNGIFRAPDV